MSLRDDKSFNALSSSREIFNSSNEEKHIFFISTFTVSRILSSHKDTIIQKADKGNSIVILNKTDYTKRMTEMLLDIYKLKKLDVKPGKELSLLLKHEDKLVSFLKGIKKSIGEDLYKSLYPQGSQPGILYGSSKIHQCLLMAFLN